MTGADGYWGRRKTKENEIGHPENIRSVRKGIINAICRVIGVICYLLQFGDEVKQGE